MSRQYIVLERYNVICAPPPETKHLAVVSKNFYFHAPILWIKQSLLALSGVIKT